MLFGGDEFGKTKQGNNNTYCQDNELSWLQWELDEEGRDLLAFTSFLIALRRQHPIFRRKSFFRGHKLSGRGVRDIHWFRPDGREMRVKEWNESFARSVGMLLVGDAIHDLDGNGEKIIDDSFLILLNAHWEPIEFRLPKSLKGKWVPVLDTNIAASGLPEQGVPPSAPYLLEGRSLVLFRLSVEGAR